jgi:quinol monooxygenase YgiN
MRPIKVTAKFKIKPGNLETFKALIPKMIAEVMENDPGTLVYEWFLNEDIMECVAWEVYKDSDSVLAHTGNIGGYLDQMLELSDASIEIFGNPSQELIDAAEGLGIKIYPFVDGI